MKYKVGDKVKIKSKEWCDEHIGCNVSPYPFIPIMKKYCGRIATIVSVNSDNDYFLDVDYRKFHWSDYVFEDKICKYAYAATESIKRNKEIIKHLESLGGINSNRYSGNLFSYKNMYYYIDFSGYIKCKNSLDVPKGYIMKDFFEQEKRTIEIDLETARKWYYEGGELKKLVLQVYTEKELFSLPKTWEECYKLAKPYEETIVDSSFTYLTTKGLSDSLVALSRLILCRDVYRQDWKPDWSDSNPKYCITYLNDIPQTMLSSRRNLILSFQDEKTCKEFMSNFSDLIEKAKEFL